MGSSTSQVLYSLLFVKFILYNYDIFFYHFAFKLSFARHAIVSMFPAGQNFSLYTSKTMFSRLLNNYK